jgi:hypothetical protein
VQARLKSLRANLGRIEDALASYNKNIIFATHSLLSAHKSAGNLSPDAHEQGCDEDDECYSHGSGHSGRKSFRRGSESSLVNVSLGGDTSE